MKKIFEWIVWSSADPEKIALTVKWLIPLVVAGATIYGVELSEGDLVDFGVKLVAAVSACGVAFGAGRKIWYSFKKRG